MKTVLGGVAAVLFGVAAVLGAGGYLIGNLPGAQAQDFGPVVSGGEMPFVSGGGVCLASATCSLYTVPADKVLILTGLSCRDSWYTLYASDGVAQTEVFRGHSGAGTSYGNDAGAPGGGAGFLAGGRGTVPIPGGSTLEINPTGVVHYSWQGYLAAP